MRYVIDVPDGFLLKGLHHFRTDKGADLWWAYVQTEKPEYGKYHHFQGAQGFSLDEAIAKAHAGLVKSLEDRKPPRPVSSFPNINIKLDLSKLNRPIKPTFELPDEDA